MNNSGRVNMCLSQLKRRHLMGLPRFFLYVQTLNRLDGLHLLFVKTIKHLAIPEGMHITFCFYSSLEPKFYDEKGLSCNSFDQTL